MHFMYIDSLANYYVRNTLLPTCTVERELESLIQDILKVFEQCVKAANNAEFWGVIKIAFSHR